MRTLLGVETAGVALLGGDRCFVQHADGRTCATRACWADSLPGWALLTPAGAAGVVTEAGAAGKRCGQHAQLLVWRIWEERRMEFGRGDGGW